MARTPQLYDEQLPPRLKGKGYISKQRRIYERIDGKFVGIGYKITLFQPKTQRRDVYFIQDDEIISIYDAF